jgi:hemerythrin-like domain-containing protein
MEAPTLRFQRQHQELQSMAMALIDESKEPTRDARQLRIQLARFAGKLRIHAAMETKALYPSLLASEVPEVRSKTQQLFEELGPVYDSFNEFELRWEDAETIANNRREFRKDLIRIMFLLGSRMLKEDSELYPLADQAWG